jgi:16S rRNA (cytosine967-C5)-methyltransferase
VCDSSLVGQFDFVLADVPCSGLGVMSPKPEIRLRTDAGTYGELTGTQFEILQNAFRYTRPGGRICYSTCTLNKDENEKVVERFMRSIAAEGGEKASKGQDGFARIVEMNTFLPYNNLIGFYYCIIEKSF